MLGSLPAEAGAWAMSERLTEVCLLLSSVQKPVSWAVTVEPRRL